MALRGSEMEIAAWYWHQLVLFKKIGTALHIGGSLNK